jgi:hypothetical protein
MQLELKRMLRFCGFDLELTVDRVLQRQPDQPAVFGAADEAGDRWLIVEAGSDDHQISWICAPASERVLSLVAAGEATTADAVRHSRTGWVEVVRVVDGHAVPERRVACSELAAIAPAAIAPAGTTAVV